MGEVDQITLLPVKINDPVLAGIGRGHVHGASLKQVSLFDLLNYNSLTAMKAMDMLKELQGRFPINR